MQQIMLKFTTLCGFGLGVLLALFVYQAQRKCCFELQTLAKTNNYRHKILFHDFAHYNNFERHEINPKFDPNQIKLNCVLLVRKRKNAFAANATWGQYCNGLTFVYLQPEKIQKTKLPIRQTKLESSWHLLCDALRKIHSTYDWSLFLNDDTFALPENVRRMVAALNPDQAYYLGHAISFWGVEYNIAQAGYVLSRNSINLLQTRFKTTEDCAAGGRFWKQEDYYLGKHLASFNVYPSDTRDSNGRTTFHGHNLAQLVSPDSFSSLALTVYYSRSIYPATKCCSPFTVTFQTIEADKMYTNHYLLYQLRVFQGDSHLNKTQPKLRQEDENEVWKSFVRQQRGNETDVDHISAEAYYELWKSVVNDPVNFNKNIRKWSAPDISSRKELQSQSDLLSEILDEYHRDVTSQ